MWLNQIPTYSSSNNQNSIPPSSITTNPAPVLLQLAYHPEDQTMGNMTGLQETEVSEACEPPEITWRAHRRSPLLSSEEGGLAPRGSVFLPTCECRRRKEVLGDTQHVDLKWGLNSIQRTQHLVQGKGSGELQLPFCNYCHSWLSKASHCPL